MSFTATLYQPEQARAVMAQIWPKVLDAINAGKKLEIVIKQLKKSRDQEEKYHALIGDIHRAMTEIGSEWSRDDWKRLLIDQWAQDMGQEGSRIAPSLDGKRVVQLGLQSRKFTVAEGSSFIEWLYAWGADKGVAFSD